jgi:hypothetical protein
VRYSRTGVSGGSVHIRLAAPRCLGKTTLLDAHVDATRELGHRAVRVDFSRRFATVADAAARVAGAYAALPADPQQRRALDQSAGDEREAWSNGRSDRSA